LNRNSERIPRSLLRGSSKENGGEFVRMIKKAVESIGGCARKRYPVSVQK